MRPQTVPQGVFPFRRLRGGDGLHGAPDPAPVAASPALLPVLGTVDDAGDAPGRRADMLVGEMGVAFGGGDIGMAGQAATAIPC